MNSYIHQSFGSTPRRSQALRNDRCQNILYKTVLEHFKEISTVATLLLTSKSFQNSSFGANFLVNFVVDAHSIRLLASVLSPSSCFSTQFTPSLHIKQSWERIEKLDISDFVDEMFKTKYLHSSLRSLALVEVTSQVVGFFFRSSTSNAWPQLQNLSLPHCEVNDEAMAVISRNALQLRIVNLSGNSSITDAGFERLSKLSAITSLNLASCNIMDARLEHVAKLSGITSLNLYNCRMMTDVGLDQISKLSCITFLNLCSCNKITDAGLEHISKLSSITSLDLGGCELITDHGIQCISRLVSITSLDLSNCNKVSSDGFEHLVTLSRVTSLNLSFNRGITDAALEHISNLGSLAALKLCGCKKITDAGLEHLAKLSSIASVNLWGCDKLTEDAKAKLKVALPKCNV